MTLTQMHLLSKAIDRRTTIRFHAEASFFATLQGAKIKPLDEILGEQFESKFDEKTDKALEQYALERIKQLGGQRATSNN